MFRQSILGALIAIIALGCAQTDHDAKNFQEVATLAQQRTGAESIRWDRSSDDAKAIAQEVHRLLQTNLTPGTAVQIALLNNRSLQATYEDLGIAQADVVQAGLMKNPVLDMQFRFPDTSPKLTDLEFALAADFLDALLIPARKKIAAAQFQAAEARVGGAIMDLAADVRATWFSLVGARQMLQLQQTALKTVETSAEAATSIRRAGNISELDLLSYQSQYQEQQIALADARAEVAELQEKLTALLGLDEATEFKLDDELPALPESDPSAQSLQQTAIDQRFDLIAARQAIEVAARNGGLVRATQYVDGLEVGVATERQTDGQWITGPTISLPIPLFDQGQARVAKAQAQVRQAEQTYKAMKTQLRSDIRRVCTHLETARLKSTMYRDSIIPMRGKIVEQSQRFYNGMLLGVFDLLRAKQNELDAHRQYIAAIRDYWVEYSQLERTVGGRLPASTTRPATTVPATQPAQPGPEHHHHGG